MSRHRRAVCSKATEGVGCMGCESEGPGFKSGAPLTGYVFFRFDFWLLTRLFITKVICTYCHKSKMNKEKLYVLPTPLQAHLLSSLLQAFSP